MNWFYRQAIDEEHIPRLRNLLLCSSISIARNHVLQQWPQAYFTNMKKPSSLISPFTPTYHIYTPHVHNTCAHHTCTPPLHTPPARHTSTTPAHHTCIPHLRTTPAHHTCIHAQWTVCYFELKFLKSESSLWFESEFLAELLLLLLKAGEEGNPAFYIWWGDIMVPENPLQVSPGDMCSGMMRLWEQLQPWQQSLLTSVDSLQLSFSVWINPWPSVRTRFLRQRKNLDLT